MEKNPYFWKIIKTKNGEKSTLAYLMTEYYFHRDMKKNDERTARVEYCLKHNLELTPEPQSDSDVKMRHLRYFNNMSDEQVYAIFQKLRRSLIKKLEKNKQPTLF